MLDGGPVGDRRRIEYDEVRDVTSRDAPTVFQAQLLGGEAGHLINGGLQRPADEHYSRSKIGRFYLALTD